MNINARLTAIERKAGNQAGPSVSFIEGEDGTVDDIRQLTEDAIRSGCGMVLVFADSEPSQPWPTSNKTTVFHFDEARKPENVSRDGPEAR